VHPQRSTLRENPGYAYEKMAPPYVCMRIANPDLPIHIVTTHKIHDDSMTRHQDILHRSQTTAAFLIHDYMLVRSDAFFFILVVILTATQQQHRR